MDQGAPTLNDNQYERYSRHLRVPGFSVSNQDRLITGRVLVIGLGGLGSPTCLYLAAAGVGTLGLADFDRVERNNLQRQVLFNDTHVGLPKIDAACERLRSMNPDLSVNTHPNGIHHENALELVRNYDVVVDCTDNFDTRFLIHDACYFEKRPLVHGNVFRAEGQVMVFHPNGGTACYRCLFPEPPKKGTIPDCNEAGVFGAACGMVGSFQAMEVIKLLSGYGQGQVGMLHRIDLTTNRFHSIPIPKQPGCPLCGQHPSLTQIPAKSTSDDSCFTASFSNTMNATPLEISPEQAVTMKKAGAVMLDVREAEEVDICRIEGSLWIPMAEIPSRVAGIPNDRTVVVYCHHGMRSMRVTQFLRQAGLENAINMRGGIAAWAAQIDPDMACY